MKKNDPRYAEIYEFGIGLLKESPLVLIKEFDSQIVEKFDPERLSENLPGRKRTKVENLADWVKASLTRHDSITYWNSHIAYLPVVGNVHGISIVEKREVLRLFRAMQNVTVLKTQ